MVETLRDRTSDILDAMNSSSLRCMLPGCREPIHKDRAGHPFCSARCERKAMVLKHGTMVQRHVAQAKRLDPTYLGSRLVDGGLWPGADFNSKAAKVAARWKGQ